MIRIGDIHIPYGRIEPFATTLGTTVDLIRSTKSKATTSDAFEQFYGWMLAQVKNKTFLRGMGDIIRYTQDQEGAAQYGKRWMLNAVVPHLIRQPLRKMDKFEREWKTRKWWYDAIPLSSGSERKVDPATGKDIKKPATPLTRIVLPRHKVPAEKQVQSDELLANWNRENPGESWGPTRPPQALNLLDDKGIIDLGPKAYNILSKRSALFAQRNLRGELNSRQIRKPTEEDLKIIKKAYEDGRSEARAEIRDWPLSRLQK